LIGSAVGPYQILDRIGVGGMGEVFLGHDPRLQRRVALKRLTADAVVGDRILREARAAARLNHPNIAAVYDVIEQDDQSFIVMEYVEGESLAARLRRGAPSVDEIRAVGRQLASALAAAHAQGVVHRDLKPANVMIARDGGIKVLDFGVAKLSTLAAGTESVTGLAAPESTLAGNPGTPVYMSPEQLYDRPVDGRTDLYSAGVILYEMATGRRPYAETGAVALAMAMAKAPPPSPRSIVPSIHADLDAAIMRALERDPDRRFQTARELETWLLPTHDVNVMAGARRDPPARRIVVASAIAAVLVVVAVAGRLFWTRSAAAPPPAPPPAPTSIAVLPLQNLSGNIDDEYVADGMTEEIIAELGRVRSLRVISRQSVLGYKKTTATIPQIARELGVASVMTGSVSRTGDRLRVRVEVIQPSPERQIWSETYDRSVGDVLILSGEVARATVRAVRAVVKPEEQARLARPRAMLPEAQQAYLMGRFFWNRRAKADIERAIKEFERAIAVDPNAGLAYAGLADCYIVAWDQGYLPPERAYREAKASATKALALDDDIAEAHASLGAVYSFTILWTQAEREYQRALELNPGYTTAHQWYSINLGALGRHAEAVAEAQRALDLDPLSPIQNLFLGRQLYFAGDYVAAERQLRKTIEFAPDLPMARHYLGRVYLEQGDRTSAIRALEEGARLVGRPTGDLGYGYGVTGDKPSARRVLDRLIAESRRQYVHPLEMALVYVGLGDSKHGVDWILKEYAEREGVVQDLVIDPRLKSISEDPRFLAILQKSGLKYVPGRVSAQS
jgi:TolB-like protein/Flp pilus assembly protein TadD